MLERASTFRVRHYECDALGHLNNTNYLRYILEATIRTLTSVGCDSDRLEGPHYAWRATEVFVDFLRPLRYGDGAEVTATASSLQQDQALWNHEIRDEKSREVCATSTIEFAFQEATSGQPAVMPENVIEQLGPLTARAEHPAPITFPTLAPRPPEAYTELWPVQWRDIGRNQRLNTAAYLDYLLDFVLNAAACGWTYRRMAEEGFLSVIRRQWLRISEPCGFDRELMFATWLSNIRRSSVTRHFTIERRGENGLTGEAHTTWVCVDRQSGKAIRIPETWLQDFAPQISR